jgi:nitroreductase
MPSTGPISDSQLLEQLNWRYAVKKFDTTRKISHEHLKTLEEAIRHSPSSYGLQPWKCLVISDAALRAKLRPAAYNQPQVTDASHLVVFCYKKTVTEADIDAYMKRIAEVRGIPIDSLAGMRGMMIGDLVHGPRHHVIDVWTSRQVYIALGTLLTSAALLGIDAGPMEGFDPKQFDEILGLSKHGLASVALCALGYRAADDPAAKHAKVRFPHEVLIEHR